MANKKQVNLIQCEGTEISRVIYPLGILMAGEMNYTHPPKRLMGIKPLERVHQKALQMAHRQLQKQRREIEKFCC